MVISDFHKEFKVRFDKTDSLNFPDFLPEEIDTFLNIEIERFINQRMYGTNPKGEGVEETQKRFDDILTLVTNANITPNPATVNNKKNGNSITLPSDYWHSLQEEAKISYADCNGNIQTPTVPVYPVMHDEYNKIIRDPFNKPDETSVIRLGLSGTIEAITGNGIALTNYIIRYVRKPAQVRYGSTYAVPISPDVQCDLPESVHKEIIQGAVLMALKNVEQNSRVQTETVQLATQE